jgi:hypothetical protein
MRAEKVVRVDHVPAPPLIRELPGKRYKRWHDAGSRRHSMKAWWFFKPVHMATLAGCYDGLVSTPPRALLPKCTTPWSLCCLFLV